MKLREINEELERLMQIRYIKLHFQIQYIEDGRLPEHKTSALRGGMGEMLLRSNCIRDRKCESCDFEEECIVQRTMYSKTKEKASFVTNGDSIGYVMECEDSREYVEAGDTMDFNLILFGRTIVYFNQYLQALYALGMNGLGKDQLHFQIIGIYNSQKQEILDGSNVYMDYYKIETVADYVNRRLHRFEEDQLPTSWKLHFYTPLHIKYQGKEQFEFCMDGILAGIKRRLYMLDLFEEIEDADQYYYSYGQVPEIKSSKAFTVKVPRFSFRKSQKMYLKGIRGHVITGRLSPEEMALFYAGELFHIGKHTSFGFGKYRVAEYREG